MIHRPDPNEYSPYYERYVSLVPPEPLLETLGRQLRETASFLRSVPASREEFRYADGKWSAKEVVGHIIDTERIMAYRLLRVARGDRTPLAGFNENEFVEGANFASRSLADLIQEYEAVRRSTIALAESLAEEAWELVGNASGYDVSARALGYIIAGHEHHHLNIIRDRYLI